MLVLQGAALFWSGPIQQNTATKHFSSSRRMNTRLTEKYLKRRGRRMKLFITNSIVMIGCRLEAKKKASLSGLWNSNSLNKNLKVILFISLVLSFYKLQQQRSHQKSSFSSFCAHGHSTNRLVSKLDKHTSNSYSENKPVKKNVLAFVCWLVIISQLCDC